MRLFHRDSAAANLQRKRPWAVTACGRLLGLQGFALIFLAWMNAPTSPNPAVSEVWLPISFSLMGLFAVLSSISFLRLGARARNRAMLLQGISLALALFLYFGERPGYIYPLMVYGIFMVLYLQHPDVRACFPYDPIDEEGEALP
jgi:hypothetical protein